MLVLAVGFWILCGATAALIGARKGMRGQGFALGFVLGPIGVVLALAAKGDRRECPFCRELVDPAAVVCPRCQRSIDPLVPATEPIAEPAPVISRRLLPRWAKAAILITVIGGTAAFFVFELAKRRP